MRIITSFLLFSVATVSGQTRDYPKTPKAAVTYLLLVRPMVATVPSIILFLVLGLAPMYCPAQSLTESVNPQQTATKATYLVVYRPGPAWLTGKSVMEQPLKEHGKYMLSLYIKGSMRLAGPLTDNAGGAVLLEVSDEGRGEGDRGKRPGSKVWNVYTRNAPLETATVGRVRKES